MDAQTAAFPANIPAHVPPELVWDHAISEYALELEDPYLGAARLHEGPNIIYSTKGFFDQPSWIITRHALIQEAFLDYAHFSSAQNSDATALLGVAWKLNPLEIDPPAHAAYRRILNPWLTPKAVDALSETVRGICRSLIAEFEDHGGCEFISEFASLFPGHIFLTLMGMPRDRLDQFLKWEDAFMHGKDMPTRINAAREILHYLESYIAERRNDPRDDLVSAILAAEIDGRPLNDGEIMGMCYVLYLGGLDTVMSSLGWAMRHLASNLPLQERLARNPEDIRLMVDETQRAHGVTATRRVVTEDFEFHGVLFKKGDCVSLPTFLASRDARQYENPHVIDIDRKASHLTFANGPHFCVGMHLARREMRIVLEEFLSRFSNLRVAEGETVVLNTKSVWSVQHLPLVWDKRSPA